MVNLTFKEIRERLDEIDLPKVDLVIGVAEGGLVPASLVANKLGAELMIIKINYRDDKNTPVREEPTLLSSFEGISNKKILLVDDVSVSGKTMNKAKHILEGNEIITFACKGKADYVLFPEISDCVNWPWKYKLIDQEKNNKVANGTEE